MNEIKELQELIIKVKTSIGHKDDLKLLVDQLKEVMPNYYPKPLSTKEVCEKYQVSGRTVSRWVASGRITPISNHGKYLFDEKDVRKIR